MSEVQEGKNKDLDKGLEIDDEKELKRCVAVRYTIDCNKRTPRNSEPRMTD